MMFIKKLLLVAGEGTIPSIVYRNALEKEIDVIWFGFRFLNYNQQDIPHHLIDEFSINTLLKILETYQTNYLCLAGKIPRSFLFQKDLINDDIKQLMRQLPGYQDDQVLTIIFQKLKQQGIYLISPIEFMKDHLTPLGNLTHRVPNENEWDDIYYGVKIAKYLADNEIGQTIVLKRKAILAVEAAEGTNETIQRGVLFGKGNVVVIKVARTQQNFIQDIPTIGTETILTLGYNGGGIIAVEHGKTLLLNRDEVIEKANGLKVGIVGISVANQ
ncbi:MAG: LpxI family protein [Candidatus Atribacteria bacterium]|nr:LpxI family protein [Candidatus Atribacteria bacterium]